ncbi:MAG: hypothetical protein II912_05385 [Clostridia bacterium]|nr:hypothetical protein [Clostridia bacterium]
MGKRILGAIVGIIAVGLIAWLVTNGTRFLNANNSMQREAKTALEDYIDGNQDLPMNEYVSLEARWVIGPFAEETTTSTTNGIKATSGVSEYYFVVLKDMSFMALKTENTREIETLDRMTDWLLGVDGFPMNGETLKVQGKLKKMTDKDLLSLYRTNLMSVFSVSSTDSAVRYVYLDTTAGHEAPYLIIGGVIAVGVIALILYNRSRKKQLEAEQAAAQAAADAQQTGL